MKIRAFNHILEVSTNSLQPISHFRIHRHKLYRHLVWWKLSVLFGQPHLEEVEIHRECGGLVRNIGEDLISYCEDCEHICEGDTETITEAQWEARYA